MTLIREEYLASIFIPDRIDRKEVVFLVDTSGSMQGKPLENACNALAGNLSKLTPRDSFNIIAFSGETRAFSSSMEFATKDVVEKAIQWMSEHCVGDGGTNILTPLNEAMEMLSDSCDTVPHIFLITDGAVEDERNICNIVSSHMKSKRCICPRISTFGIGSYCNHYFLRMLALIGRGYYDAAYDIVSIDTRMQRLFAIASSCVLANITIEFYDHIDNFEVYPFPLPDLSTECPLILSGRYQGNFPDSLKAKGILAGMNSTSIDVKVQKAKDISLDKVFGRRWIDLLTAQAWFSESKELEDKVAKISIQTGFSSEYTRMVLLQAEKPETTGVKGAKKESSKKADSKENRMTLLHGLAVGFGNVTATMENARTGFGGDNLQEASEAYERAVRCCNKLSYCCCCPCCIRGCSRMNNQCAIILTQFCIALSCLGCMGCIEFCCPESD